MRLLGWWLVGGASLFMFVVECYWMATWFGAGGLLLGVLLGPVISVVFPLLWLVMGGVPDLSFVVWGVGFLGYFFLGAGAKEEKA